MQLGGASVCACRELDRVCNCKVIKIKTYSFSIAALLLLVSIVATSSFDSWPNPEAEGLSEESLSHDVLLRVPKAQRTRFRTQFSPLLPNKGELRRRNLTELLPDSDQPQLMEPNGKRPFITVVDHDSENLRPGEP